MLTTAQRAQRFASMSAELQNGAVATTASIMAASYYPPQSADILNVAARSLLTSGEVHTCLSQARHIRRAVEASYAL
jgi:hypothetical protein